MNRITRCLSLTAVIAVSGAVLGGVPGVNRTKIIGCGYDTRATNPAELLAHADEFDRSGLDGVFIMLGGKRSDGADGGMYNTRTLSTATPWTREMFLPHKAALTAFREHRGLRESLPFSEFTPRVRVSWKDDAAWLRFAHNIGVLAAFAKECGLKGLSSDNEDYRKTKQWYWLPETDGGTFEEFCAIAKARGRQIGKAMYDAFPEAVFVPMWGLSEERSYFTSPDPKATMAELRNLWPAFVEGFVLAMPPTGRFVDGDEHCYFCDAEGYDFYVHFWNQRQGALALLSPEARGTYLSRLVTGGGMYLDMFCNENNGTCWYHPPAADGTRVSRFAATLAQGARVTGDYLWVYGENGFLIPWHADSSVATNKRFAGFKTWEERLPGLTAALRSQSDPVGLAASALKADSSNLLASGKWIEWQHERLSHGTFRQEGGVLAAKGVSNGCFHREIPATTGHIFALMGAVRGRGSVKVGWSAKGQQLGELPGYVLPLGEPDAEGRRRGVFSFVVPPRADAIFLLASIAKLDPEEEAEFSHLRLIEIK